MKKLDKIGVCLLNSMGVALLVVSAILVPTSSLLADGGGPPAACAGNGACNNGCKLGSTGGACDPSTGNGGCTKLGTCNCSCYVCIYQGQGWLCNCQCGAGGSTCQNTTTCNPNNG